MTTDVINNVPRELLSDAMRMLDDHSPGSGSVESYAAQDIAALIATAQPVSDDGEREARVTGYAPGMGGVTLNVGRLPQWLELGATVHVYEHARAALSAPSHGEQVRDVSTMARVLSDRQADACNVDRDDQWKIYGQDFIEDVTAMLAAAPSAGSQADVAYEVKP